MFKCMRFSVRSAENRMQKVGAYLVAAGKTLLQAVPHGSFMSQSIIARALPRYLGTLAAMCAGVTKGRIMAQPNIRPAPATPK